MKKVKSMRQRVLRKCLSALALVVSCGGLAHAQDEGLVWQFGQNNASSGTNAQLKYHIPETDNVRVFATCGAGGPKDASHFTIAVNFGDQAHLSPTRVRFSGGGKEYEIAGLVERPQSEEGLFGVKLTVSHNDPIWQAFDSNGSLDYQVPGYPANRINLVGGQTAIKNFVEACRFLASGGNLAQTSQEPANPSGITEKEAFQMAQSLNSPAAWNAFLKVYPEGFFAELAKGYLAKSDGGNTAVAPQKPVAPVVANLPFANPGPASTPWFNSNYQQDEGNSSSYAANVVANGSEFVLWCADNKRLMAVFRENGRGIYPDFDTRVQQGVAANPNFDFSFSGGESYRHRVQVYGLTGEVGIARDFSANDPMIAAMMRDNSFDIRGGPFGATYQLKNSRRAICNVTRKCGIQAAGCSSPKSVVAPVSKPKPAVKKAVRKGNCSSRSTFVQGRGCVLNRYLNKTKKKKPAKVSNDKRCRARSVWIEGRGCVLRRSAKKLGKKSKNGCRGGRIRFEGKCLFRRELRGYCGPGFTPKGRRCVSNAVARKPKKKRGVILKRNEGGTISLQKCLARGMTPEFGYCVEDD